MQLLELIDYGPNAFGAHKESGGDSENNDENVRRRRKKKKNALSPMAWPVGLM
jgi:hypothetical protein